MRLVIVESPAKAKTIGKYLGADYSVAATMGHIMDLPKSKLGVEVEQDFEPQYDVIPGKLKVIRQLKKLLPKDKAEVYLALDPDREGEAIAAHVAEVLKLKNAKRIVFHEVTKEAVEEAVGHPRTINIDLVDAQKARRVLDRLVGYKLSGLLWKKIWFGLSAGRVQSVATRLIVDREREREAFVPKEFWTVFSHLLTSSKDPIVAKLKARAGKTLIPKSKEEVDSIVSDLDGASWKIDAIDTVEKKKHPLPPFTTSTLQQAANAVLGYSASRTMQLAQQLYQGVTIKGKGQTGLITYMRTDSTTLSAQALGGLRKSVEELYGKKYLPDQPMVYKTKSRMAQEAHEAIRPTSMTLPPDAVKDSLSPQQFKLYKLIWDRAHASQMMPMLYKESVVKVLATCKNGTEYIFVLTGREVTFDGFGKVMGYGMIREEGMQEVRGLSAGDELTCEKIETNQEFTKPKARYTEATLVKALEKHGIGRPSTYATIISTIQSRGYVDREGRYLFPTDIGFVVNDFLVEHFPDVVDYDFTSEIEGNLDDVAKGERQWVPVVKKVYVPFEKTLETKDKEVKKEDVVILGDSKIPCPECGGKMVIRLGRDGRFLSCARFPECKGMLGMDGKTAEEALDKTKYRPAEKCEKCGSDMVLKRGRFGQFWACSKYPECKNAQPLLLQKTCPECGKPLVERKGKWGRSFTGCSGYPDCKFILKEPKGKGEAKGKSRGKGKAEA
ncbi:MAG: type I DNA topoisomerase [Candidatus Dojkabacteria bacterium]|nr:type I DNA topoisomerase [Candidatus Dojkabacteria bacterium]